METVIISGKETPVARTSMTSVPITLTLASTPSFALGSYAEAKYGKKLIFSSTLDDAYISALTSGLPILAGGVADDGLTYTPKYYTDGCGNNQVFKAGVAFYAVNSAGVYLHDGTSPSYLSEANILTLFNAGWDIMNHSWSHANGSGNTPGYPGIGHPTYDVEIANSDARILAITGRSGKSLVIPAGDGGYRDPAIAAGKRVIYNQSGSDFIGGAGGAQLDGLQIDKVLKLLRISRQETDVYPTITANIDAVAAKCVGNAVFWFNDFTHTLTTTLFGGGMTISDYNLYMTYVAATYGAGGTDILWMAPLDEVWEYLHLKKFSTLDPFKITGTTVTTNINHSLPANDLRRFAWTVNINTDQNIIGAAVPAGYSYSFRGTGGNRILNVWKN